MHYYAIVRSKPNNELTHFKYTKREKVNGKWVYTYPEDLKGTPEKLEQTVRTTKQAIEAVAEKSGMKEAGIADAMLLGKKHGWDSPQYKEVINILSEGDEDYAKEYTKILKSAVEEETIAKSKKKSLKDRSGRDAGERAALDALSGKQMTMADFAVRNARNIYRK